MTHDQLILEALAYRRNVGASLADIRSYLQLREEAKHTRKHDLAAVRRLEDDGSVVCVGEKWFFTPAGNKLAKGSSLPAEWETADAWLFLAALYNRDSPEFELPNIIAAADFINHAIPTLEEIHGAVNRLLAARLLKMKAGAFSITDKARALFARVEGSCKQAVLDQLDGLRRIMDCPCCGVQLKTVRWRFAFDVDKYRQATDAYYSMVR